jgi:hypothetical protein
VGEVETEGKRVGCGGGKVEAAWEKALFVSIDDSVARRAVEG